MAGRTFNYTSRWRVDGDVSDVAAIFADPADLPRWWPAVFRAVELRDGARYAATVKAWLPFTLRWCFTLSSSEDGHVFHSNPSGDVEGTGVWTLAQDGDHVLVTFDWRVRFRKPGLIMLSSLFGALFAANHRWAMASGEQSLRCELTRRRLGSERAAEAPNPPQPLSPAQCWSMFGLVVGSLMLPGWLLLRLIRPNGDQGKGAP